MVFGVVFLGFDLNTKERKIRYPSEKKVNPNYSLITATNLEHCRINFGKLPDACCILLVA